MPMRRAYRQYFGRVSEYHDAHFSEAVRRAWTDYRDLAEMMQLRADEHPF